MPKIDQSVIGRLFYPSVDHMAYFSTSYSMSATGDIVAAIFRAGKTGTVTGFKFATNNVTTGCTLRGTLQTVDATTGAPTGTLYHANATGTVVVANTDDNIMKTLTFSGNVPVTRNDVIALVLDVSSGTPSSLGIRTLSGYVGGGLPADWRNIGGVVTQGTMSIMSVGLTWTTGDEPVHSAYGLLLTGGQVSVSSTTSPDEVGNKFVMPFNAESDGWQARSGTKSTIQPCDIVLYDSNNTVIATSSLNPNLIKNQSDFGPLSGLWDTPVNLLRGRTYRIVYKPTTSTTWTGGIYFTDSTGGAGPPGRNYLSYTVRTDGGAWTDTPSKAVFLVLSLSGLYVPGGSFF